MLKKYGKILLISSLLILLPIAVGLVLWDQLPATMNIHWNAAGEADGTAGRAFAIFFIPLLMLAMHWFCVVISYLTNKDNDQTEKAMKIVLWIIPVLTNTVMAAMYAISLGLEFNMGRIIFVPMGILFIVIGNFMPKFRRNPSMGIKTRWALADDENWYATHRFAGKVWVFGGILMLPICFLPLKWAVIILFIAIFALALSPVVYSWWFFKKQQAAGKEPKIYRISGSKWAWLISALLTAVLVPLFVIIMFTGSITFELGEDALTVDSTFYSPLTVSYENIDSIELRDGNAPGHRDWGYGSARLLLGGFSNEEFGGYTRYTYTSSDSHIVITAGKNILVIADKDLASTQLLFENICAKIG